MGRRLSHPAGDTLTMQTYKDMVRRAQELCAELLQEPAMPAGDSPALAKLLELFDGPEQRAVEVAEVANSTPEALFKIGWNALTEQTFQINVEKGFFAPHRIVVPADQLLLIICEVCEGYEHHRKGRKDDKLPHRDGLEVELADAIIRTMNYARFRGYDIPGAIIEKTAFNKKRPYLHGDTYKAEQGGNAVAKPAAVTAGMCLRTLTEAEKAGVRAKYAPQLVDFGDGFFWETETRSWQICPDLWEPTPPATQDANFTGAKN